MTRKKPGLKTGWLVAIEVVGIVALGIGTWIVLDLVPAIQHIEISEADRAAFVFVAIAAGIVAAQPIMSNHMFNEHKREIEEIVAGTIDEQVTLGTRRLLQKIDPFLIIHDLGSKDDEEKLLRQLFDSVFNLDEPMRSGVTAWLAEKPLEAFRNASKELTTGGVMATQRQHVAITRALFDAGEHGYLQVNLAAWDAKTNWSDDWKAFLKGQKRPGYDFHYVVLGTREYIAASRAKLLSMQALLERGPRGAKLFTCDIEKVRASIGNNDVADLTFNFEVFDNEVLKIHGSPPEGGYAIGELQPLKLAKKEDRPELLRVAASVREHAVRFGK